ncbi:MAG: transposase [Burkholderiales bacterium]|nr:transposase [Burkholderiales bacterium]
MARLARLAVAGQVHHVVQRGANGHAIFRDSADFERMRGLIGTHARANGVAVHSYLMLEDRFHLLVTPVAASGLSRLMQDVGRSYVRYFNDRYQRTGSLWQGRYQTTVIESERYLFSCMTYIEQEPVRLGLVDEPGAYPWSSYRHNVGLQVDQIISEHSLFWALGNTPFAREAAYRDLVEAGISSADHRAIVEATQKGWALGLTSPALDAAAARRLHPLRRGRPRKSDPI